MAKITRYNGNLQAFGSNAIGTERTVFGDTAQADDITSNVNTEFLRGWGVIPTGGKPPKQWLTGAMYAVTQMMSYLHQMGVAEWNTSQEYHVGSKCTASDGKQYRSLTSPNIGNNPTTDGGVNWIDDIQEVQDNLDTEESARISADSAHAALTNPHSATSSATANRIALRDGSGRISAGDATADGHVVNLGQLVFNATYTYGRIVIPTWTGTQNYNFVLQWKQVTLPNNASYSHTFQYAFDNACLAVFICRSSLFTSYNEESGVAYNHSTVSTTGCTLYSQMATNAMVYAIGY